MYYDASIEEHIQNMRVTIIDSNLLTVLPTPKSHNKLIFI